MRVMVFVPGDASSEAGKMPSEELISNMMKFNEELVKAGVMLAAEGLHASSEGVRVRFAGRERQVTEGPFGNTNDLVAGFWLWELPSKEEAVAWLKRAPFEDAEVEIRQVFEAEEFAPSDPTGILRKKVQELRDATRRRQP